MTPLRQRMIDDMTVRGLAENTIKSYLGAVTGLARHYRRSPDCLDAREVQDYLIFLHEKRGLTWTSCNAARHGIRFLYRITLRLPDPHLYVPGAKQPSKLPEILNREELVRLFTVASNPKHRALLMTAYAAGLRASELTRLRIADIDSGRMALRVDQGKGNKDATCRSRRSCWRNFAPTGVVCGRRSGCFPAAPPTAPCPGTDRRTSTHPPRPGPASGRRAASIPCAIATPPACWKPGWICP